MRQFLKAEGLAKFDLFLFVFLSLQLLILAPEVNAWALKQFINLFILFFLSLFLVFFQNKLSFETFLRNFFIKLIFYSLTGLYSVYLLVQSLKNVDYTISQELVSQLILTLTPLRMLEYVYNILAKTKTKPYFLLLLGLFLALAKFIYQIDFVFALYAFVSILLYYFLLIPSVFKNNLWPQKYDFKIIARLFLRAIPLTFILFFLAPYFKWTPKSSFNTSFLTTVGESGFSSELRPGSVSQINLSEQIALRLEMPLSHLKLPLYLRGQVLDKSMGLAWRKSSSEPIKQKDLLLEKLSSEALKAQNLIKYKIVLEPHQKDQLLTLVDTVYVQPIEGQALYSTKYDTYLMNSPVYDTITYEGYLNTFRDKKAQEKELMQSNLMSSPMNVFLDLPKKNSKVLSLLKELESQYLRDSQTANLRKDLTNAEKNKLLLNYFKEKNFKYATEQLSTEINSIESFLFKDKKGFCEHYASTLALLLRHWNVPARVVTGYLGGELNEIGQFVTFKDKEAHAWVEYLNEKQIWVTADATLVVAPDRFQSHSQKLSALSSWFKKSSFSFIYTSFLKIEQTLDYLNYRWITFILEGPQNTIEQIKALSLKDLIKKLLLVLGTLILAYVSYRWFSFSKTQRLKYVFELKMNYFSKRQLHETFEDWQNRLVTEFPHKKEWIQTEFAHYLEIRYKLAP